MLRSFITLIAVACAGLASVSIVGAIPMIDTSNNTLTLPPSQSTFSNNPFDGLSIDFGTHSLSSKTVLDRSIIEAQLDRRIIGAIIRVAEKVIELIVSKVKEAIAHDKLERAKFTVHVCDMGRADHKEFNWMVIHTKHRTKFEGTKGKDWDHSHKEFDVKIGGTIGYEVYYTREGQLWNNGDGDYINWAYEGFWKADGKGNKHVTFTRPPGT
ncbi:hypothetical protein C0991_004608 [Blastosporella zonata]|nr:hypothetical protein C0991_004608 [Blastosporella zonata]